MATEKRLIDANAKFIEKHFAKRLIDIYALIDVIENTDWYHINPQGKLVAGANSQGNIPLYKASDIHRALANAPTVDAVEVIHGEWRTKILCGGFAEEWGYVCSVCGCTVSDRSKLSFGKFATGNQKLNYCPNCCANMMEKK